MKHLYNYHFQLLSIVFRRYQNNFLYLVEKIISWENRKPVFNKMSDLFKNELGYDMFE